MAGSIFLDDLQHVAFLQLHAGRAQDSADGFRRPPLLADHLAQIALRHAQLEHGGVAIFHRGYLNLGRGIHQRLGNLLHQSTHIACRLRHKPVLQFTTFGALRFLFQETLTSLVRPRYLPGLAIWRADGLPYRKAAHPWKPSSRCDRVSDQWSWGWCGGYTAPPLPLHGRCAPAPSQSPPRDNKAVCAHQCAPVGSLTLGSESFLEKRPELPGKWLLSRKLGELARRGCGLAHILSSIHRRRQPALRCEEEPRLFLLSTGKRAGATRVWRPQFPGSITKVIRASSRTRTSVCRLPR